MLPMRIAADDVFSPALLRDTPNRAAGVPTNYGLVTASDAADTANGGICYCRLAPNAPTMSACSKIPAAST